MRDNILANGWHAHDMQEGVADITDRLKMYRPAATVLEAEVGKGARPSSNAVTEHSAGLQRVMARKRTAHDSAILVRCLPFRCICASSSECMQAC